MACCTGLGVWGGAPQAFASLARARLCRCAIQQRLRRTSLPAPTSVVTQAQAVCGRLLLLRSLLSGPVEGLAPKRRGRVLNLVFWN